jgi:hypothetical protein
MITRQDTHMILFRVVILFTLTLSVFITKAQSYENRDVIKMVKADFQEDLILSTLSDAEELKLDLSIDGIISLKGNGVADNLLTKLRELQNTFDQRNAALAFVLNGKKYRVPSDGIYFIENGTLTTLNSTSTTFTPPKGLVKYKVVRTLEGSNANYSISKDAQFVFVFENASKSINNPNAQVTNGTPDSFSSFLLNALSGTNKTAISPNDFKLVQLKVKRNQRSYVAGSVNILGSYDFSLDRKEVAEFNYEQIGSNIYLVTPKNLDSDAEFCFIYTQNMSRGLASGITANFFGANNNRNKVFDFGTN